jgi:hypothetical protein
VGQPLNNMANIKKEIKRKSQQLYNELLKFKQEVETNNLQNEGWYADFISKLEDL